MPSYTVTMYRHAFDLMRGKLEVEADNPEEAKAKAKALYMGEYPPVDWKCEETDWAEKNDGWVDELFEAEETA